MSAFPPDLFDDVPTFLEIVRAGSVRGAARELGLGPSALSKAVARLEARLGVQLFDRVGRGLALTDEGRAIHASFVVAADRALAARDLAQAARGRPRGVLRTSTSPVLVPLLARTTARLVDRHPELDVRLSVSDAVVSLADAAVDVAVRLGDAAPEGAVRRKLGSTRFVLVASPEYLARRGHPRRRADLEGHAAIRFVPPNGVPQRWGLGDDELSCAATASDGPAVVALAIEGVGLARVLSFMVNDALATGRLIALLPEDDAPGPDVYAIGSSSRMRTPRARAFVEVLLDEAPSALA